MSLSQLFLSSAKPISRGGIANVEMKIKRIKSISLSACTAASGNCALLIGAAKIYIFSISFHFNFNRIKYVCAIYYSHSNS